jgi:hypothetical protein
MRIKMRQGRTDRNSENGCEKIAMRFHAASEHVRLAGLIALSIVAITLSGCGSNLSHVTGLVTLDGAPLRGSNDVRATVYFQPVSGNGTTAIGLLDENGRYRLSSGSQEGAAPGKYFVTCSAAQLIRSQDGRAAGGRRITNLKYANAKTSGLKFSVQPGSNEFDIRLESRPSQAVSRSN